MSKIENNEVINYIKDDFKEFKDTSNFIVDKIFGMFKFIFKQLHNFFTGIAKQWKMFLGLFMISILIIPFIKNKEILIYIIFYFSSIIAGLIVIGLCFSLIAVEIVIVNSIIKEIKKLVKNRKMGNQKIKFIMKKIECIFKIIGLVIAFFVVLITLIPLLWIYSKISEVISKVYNYFSSININVNTNLDILSKIRYGLRGMYNVGDFNPKMSCSM